MVIMNYLVFDIETVPLPFESFSESQQEYILRGTETEDEVTRRMGEMALTPLTAQVVCIGLKLVEKKDNEYKDIISGAISVDNSMGDDEHREVTLSSGEIMHLYNEKQALSAFWKTLKKYNPHLISFNGRNFDAPFLMLRSALLGIRPTKNLMQGTKFKYDCHTDLIDELTFYSTNYNYGATKRFNFDFYTRAFGITSPKAQGIDGTKVPEFFNEGKIVEITEYCLRDVEATWELYKIWEKFLKF